MKMLAVALLELPSSSLGSLDPRNEPPAVTISVSSAREEELLLYALELEALTLTDSLTGYGDPSDPHLPVGELARLLDLDLAVSPSEQRITGSLGQQRRSVAVDLRLGVAHAGGRDIQLTPDDTKRTAADIYIRASILEQVLPVRFKVNAEELSIRLAPTETLPIQARMERLAKHRGLDRNVAPAEKVLEISSPYRAFTAPSFDATFESGYDSRRRVIPRRYDLRVAADLLFTGFEGYLGSDEQGQATTARLLLERRSSSGALPFGVRRISAGDVFTPSLPLGPRSVGGRGISLSTAPLGQLSVFQTIDLRGELPIGYDVELYVNDVLRESQGEAIAGRYEFLAVPLAYGVNLVRIVLHGPKGERSEHTRLINVGGGQLRKNQTTLELGFVQQEKAVFEPSEAVAPELVVTDVAAPRIIASLAHGLTDTITMVGGLALYSSTERNERHLGMLGLRTSVGPYALQLDAAGDRVGGLGMAVGLAGQPFKIATFFRHSEYRGGFVDENIVAPNLGRTLSRRTFLTTDLSLPLFRRKTIPVALRIIRDGYVDGGSSIMAGFRASTTIARTLVSNGLDYQLERRPEEGTEDRLAGTLTASKFVNFSWQLRAALDYDLLPQARVRNFSVTADKAVSQSISVRLGIGQTLVRPRETFLQAGSTWRLPVADIGFTADYIPQRQEGRFGVRLSFGGLFDPGRRRYLITPTGPAAGGNAIFRAFVDHDGNGRFSKGDDPVAGVELSGAARKILTGKDGRAVVSGLGTAPTGQLQVNSQEIERVYVAAPPSTVRFPPRPGRVIQIPYPLVPVGEVSARLVLNQQERPIGLSSVRVRLVREKAEPLVATTEFDGSVVFSEVPAGSYRLELDPEQSDRLHMRLAVPVTVTVEADGSVELVAEVEFQTNDPKRAEPNQSLSPVLGAEPDDQ
jgi:hypothetical protein